MRPTDVGHSNTNRSPLDNNRHFPSASSNAAVTVFVSPTRQDAT
jgi:hypothetical protein